MSIWIRRPWQGKGNRIAFTSEKNGNADIFIMDTNGNILSEITNHPGHDAMPF